MGPDAAHAAAPAQGEAMMSAQRTGARRPARCPGHDEAAHLFLEISQEGCHRSPGTAHDAGCRFPARHFLILTHASQDARQNGRPAFSPSGMIFEEAALAEHCPHWRQFASRPLAADQGLAAVVRNQITMIAEYAGNMDPEAAAAMVAPTIGLIAAWLNALDPQTAPQLSSLPAYHRKRIRDFVLAQLCNPMLSVDMVAQGVGLSVRYIHHLFESEPVSLMQWANTLRLEHCREQLTDPRRRDWRISQIAYGAGFNDLAHFSRSYRKRFQVSPTQDRTARSL